MALLQRDELLMVAPDNYGLADINGCPLDWKYNR
jgi:hypothetical protein